MFKVALNLTSRKVEKQKVGRNPFFTGFAPASSIAIKQGLFTSPAGDTFEKKTTLKDAKKLPSRMENLVNGLNDAIDTVKDVTGGLISSYANALKNNLNQPVTNKNSKIETELLKELQSYDKQKLQTAIALLGKLKSTAAVDPLTEILSKNSTEKEIAAEIITALAHINNSQVVQPIIDILQNTNKDEGLRSMAALTLGQMKNRRASKPLFEVLKNRDDSPVVRSYSALALSEFPTIRNTDQLVRSLNDTSELVRANAVLSLGALGHNEAIPKVVRLLKDPDPNVRSNTALTLGNLKAKETIDALVETLKDPNSDVVISIARALNFIDGERATKKLLSVIENSSNPLLLRRNAAASLQLIQEKTASAVLKKVLADKGEDLVLRNHSLTALSKMKCTDCLPVLLTILNDNTENFQLKINAAAAIGEIGSKQCINELIETAQETQVAELKNNAVNAIRTIAARNTQKSNINTQGLISLLADDNERIRAMVADTLGILKCKESVKPLLELATNTKEEPIARAYAISSLGLIGDKQAANKLLNIVKKDENHKICARAAVAVYNLGFKAELMNIVKSRRESFNVKNHAAGVLISMGEKNKDLEAFLRPGLNVKLLHKAGIQGQGIEVAIIDDSIDANHAELNGRVIIEKLESHGTMVSGSLGGNISGVAPKAIIHSYNAFEGKQVDQILEKIIDQKINGENDIKVVNISLGFNPKLLSDPEIEKVVERFDQLSKMATRLGMTIVVAAGNDGRDMPVANFGTMNLLCQPENVISVGAAKTNGTPDNSNDDTRAEFSSYPEQGAPRQLDVLAPGFELTLPYKGGSYKTVDGTSFAAPFVAGLSTLMYQIKPEIQPLEVKNIINSTATKLKNTEQYLQGNGEVNPLKAIICALKSVDSDNARELIARLEKHSGPMQLSLDMDALKKIKIA